MRVVQVVSKTEELFIHLQVQNKNIYLDLEKSKKKAKMPKSQKYKNDVKNKRMVFQPISIGEKNLAKALGVKRLKSILRMRSKEAPTKSVRKKVDVVRRSASFSDVPRRTVRFSSEISYVKFVVNAPPSKSVVEKGVEKVPKRESEIEVTDKMKNLKC